MSCPFAKYSEILGKPNEGFHAKRVNIFNLNLAANDLYGTISISLIISFILYFITNMNIIGIILIPFIILMLLAIILHSLFCVNTALNNAMFNR